MTGKALADPLRAESRSLLTKARLLRDEHAALVRVCIRLRTEDRRRRIVTQYTGGGAKTAGPASP